MSITTPCLCCKFLERVCSESCPTAPFFPATQPQIFEKLNRLYGASNILRMLEEVPESDRKEMFDSFNFEVGVRAAQPITGCAGIIIYLQRRAEQAESELKAIKEGIQFLLEEGQGSCPSGTTPEPFGSEAEPFATTLGLCGTTYGPCETLMQQNEQLNHKRPIDDVATDHNLGKKLKCVAERVVSHVVPIMQDKLETELNKYFTLKPQQGKEPLLDMEPSLGDLYLEDNPDSTPAWRRRSVPSCL